MKFLEGIPDILYKYRDWNDENHKRIITKNELFFASADLFNDPFDATLPFKYKKDEMTEENIIKKLFLTGRDMYPNISEEELQKMVKERLITQNFNSDKYWRDNHQNFINETNKTYGIFSLSSKSDNLLMWSHYAKAHTGFCIGFCKYELFETVQGAFGKIHYSEHFPTMPLFGDNVPYILEILMTKSKDWEYEDEYRLIKVHAPRSVFIYNDSCIKEIIFGCKMTQKNREEIIEVVQSKKSKIKLYECLIDNEEFKLNLIDV